MTNTRLICLLTLAVAGCRDVEPTRVLPQGVGRLIQEEAVLDTTYMDGEKEFRRLEHLVPEFGGYYTNESGTLVLTMTDLSKGPQIEALARSGLEEGGVPLNTAIEYRKIDYSFAALRKWRDKLNWPVFGIRGVVSVDLNEVTNRVTIGISDDRVRQDVEQTVARLAIPLAPIAFEIVRYEPDVIRFKATMASFAPGDSLTSRNRPANGGLAVAWYWPAKDSIFGCTIWLGVRYGSPSQDGFMTNSHCSPYLGSPSVPAYYHQPDTITASNEDLIGHEVTDPAFTSCGSGNFCRNSDALFAVYDSSAAVSFGRIARPSGAGAYNTPSAVGPLDIDGANPEFVVTSEAANPTLGTRVDKVGYITGWTPGPVTNTCVNHTIRFTFIPFVQWIATCAVRARYGRDHGDSGGPVFRYSAGSNNVALQGMHIGVALIGGPPTTDTVGVFVTISKIRSDFPTGLVTY